MAQTRISTRRRPQAQYNVDPLQDLDLSESSESAQTNEPNPDNVLPRPPAARNSKKGGFESGSDDYAPPADSAEDDNEEDILSVAGFHSSEGEGPEQTPELEPSDVSEFGEDEGAGNGRLIKGPIKASFKKAAALRGEGRRETDRGRSGIDFNQRDTRILAFFGNDVQVLKAVQKARDKWTDDATLPSRKADENGFGGFAPSPFYYRSQREADVRSDWIWYDEGGGRERFAQIQDITIFPAEDAAMYVFPQSQGPTNIEVLAGPLSKQTNIPLDRTQCLNMARFWETPHQTSNVSKEFGPLGKNAWLINVGGPVDCLQWLANQRGDHHYLSVVTALSRKDVEKPSAFARSPGPASIQVWRFAACREGHNEDRPDFDVPPVLVAVICSDWGRIKALKWCPFPRSPDHHDPDHLGPLGIVSGDGYVRVFDITIPNLVSSRETSYLKLSKPAFECCPPDTTCTTVDWLSSSLLASGHANGYLSIWDISDLSITLPFFFQRLHTSYITATIALAPSRPNLLATSSVDGHIRITDIYAPQVDTVRSHRVLFLPTWLVWSDNTQSVIASHTREFLDFLPIRSFGGTFRLYRHKSAIQHVAVCPNHASLLSSDASGEVIISNPIRKVYYPKREIRTIVQTWFLHEVSSKSDTTVRFVEGFLAEEGKAIKGNKKEDEARKKDVSDRDNYVVFEEKSAVTQLAWNPNLKVSGWAAAGMASGLVRVQDLAV